MFRHSLTEKSSINQKNPKKNILERKEQRLSKMDEKADELLIQLDKEEIFFKTYGNNRHLERTEIFSFQIPDNGS